MADCLFCKIAAGAIPVTRVYEDDEVLCFPDLHPQAPTHLLLIPKRHLASLADSVASDSALLGKLLGAAAQVAKAQRLERGYRVVGNAGEDGGQSVPHLHLHLLGGRPMTWPPG